MKNLMIFCSSLVISTSLVSCASTGGAGAPSKTQAFALQGCGAGAVAGGLLGLISGGDKVLKGAALGCGLGAIIGYSIGKRTQKYVDAEQAMDAEIARNQQNTRELKSYNGKLAQGIRTYQNKINTIRAAKIDASAKQIQLANVKSTAQKQLNKAQSALNSVNKEIVVAKKQQVTYTTKTVVVEAKPAKVKKRANNNAKWKAEIANLEKEKNILNKHVKSLTALSSSI